MELRELRALHALIDTGSVDATAAQLNYSPSGVRRCIKQLQTDTGDLLVERTATGLSVTPAGQALLNGTREAIRSIDRASDLARRAATNQTTRICIGLNGGSALGLLQRALPALLSVNPLLDIEVIEGPTGDLIQLVETASADVAFVRPPIDDEQLADRWLLDEELMAVLPRDHPLADAKAVHLSDLADDAFVLPPPSRSTRARRMITRACADFGGFQPTRVQEATTTAGMLLLVAAGAGITILPRQSLNHYRTAGVTSCHILDDIPPLPLHLVWRNDDTTDLTTAVRSAILEPAHSKRL